MMNFFKNLFNYDGSYYPQKCKDGKHYGKVRTPTLSRRVISVDAPCQCGYYQGHKHFMEEQHKKLKQVLKEIEEENP